MNKYCALLLLSIGYTQGNPIEDLIAKLATLNDQEFERLAQNPQAIESLERILANHQDTVTCVIEAHVQSVNDALAQKVLTSQH